jgi:hypothetical protein
LAAVMVCRPAFAAAETPPVNVTQAPAAALQVGDPFEVKAEAPKSGERFLLTLMLVDQVTGANVDLEGWIPMSAGQQVSGKAGEAVTWAGKAGKAGQYRVYVTAVPLDRAGMISSSAPSDLTVNPVPALHAGPLMGVAVAEPAALALVIGWMLIRRRRNARQEGVK